MIFAPSICLLLLLIHGCCVARAMSTTSPVGNAISSSILHPPTYKKKAIVVGGGPVGLATAITLSNPPHCMNVTLFEQSTPSAYDPTKAYLYMVNGRGQTWTQRFPRVQELLVERGSRTAGGMGNFCIVPADPNEEIPTPKPITQSNDAEKVVNKESYWIPRHTMTQLLQDVIVEQQENNCGERGCIDLRLGMRFVSMETTNGGNMLQVTVQNVKDPNVRYEEVATAPFVIGADGMNSQVCSLTRKLCFSSFSNDMYVKASPSLTFCCVMSL